MNNLEKMKQSCNEFAADLKTRNVNWQDLRSFKNLTCDFRADVLGKELDLYLHWEEIGDTHGTFRLFINSEYPIILQSTTAKEAAFEALELVKKEAQKLVDFFGG